MTLQELEQDHPIFFQNKKPGEVNDIRNINGVCYIIVSYHESAETYHAKYKSVVYRENDKNTLSAVNHFYANDLKTVRELAVDYLNSTDVPVTSKKLAV